MRPNATILMQLATGDFRLTVMRNASACAEVNLEAVAAMAKAWRGPSEVGCAKPGERQR